MMVMTVASKLGNWVEGTGDLVFVHGDNDLGIDDHIHADSTRLRQGPCRVRRISSNCKALVELTVYVSECSLA